MSIVVGFADIRPDQITRKRQPGGQIITTSTFLRTTKDVPIAPTAYIARFEPGCAATPHYHLSDEFQIIFDGKGKFGRHDVSPYCVHFARAYTSYGPLLADKETGWAFITLRTRYDPGSQRQFDEMRRIPDRRPWQITKKITFPSHVKDVSQQDDPDIRDEQGLLVRAISMAPNTKISTPDPTCGDGQFVVVFKGSLLHESKEHKAMAVVCIQSGESPFQVHAGEHGLDGLILNLPQVKLRPETKSLPATVGFKKWQCTRCAFAYDEAVGIPDEGIAVGTRWEDVPETWSCPDCSAHKSDFEMIEV